MWRVFGLRGKLMAEDVQAHLAELRNAYKRMEDALMDVIRISRDGGEMPNTVPTEWTCLVRNQGWDDDGDRFGFISTLAPIGLEAYMIDALVREASKMDFDGEYCMHDEDEDDD
jgi:hypothetical protein